MNYVLRSKRRNPPSGWTFRQAETNWSNPNPMGTTFDKSVAAIVAMRLNNPRHKLETDPAKVAIEFERYTCARLKNADQWCTPDLSELPEEQKAEEIKKKDQPTESPGTETLSFQRPRVLGPGKGVRPAAVKHSVNGWRILRDWLGEGGLPVTPQLAEQRAEVCVQCPKNVRSDWLTRVSGAVAKAVLEQRRAKTALAITVPQESELGTCDVCLCNLALKVHVPLPHIIKHTSHQVWSELPTNCWIKREFGADEIYDPSPS